MRDQLFGRAGEAIMKAISEHTDEKKLEKEVGGLGAPPAGGEERSDPGK